jgi:subtilase family serine protease
VHLWRINASASYSTFPTALQYGIGGTATSRVANTSADGSYTSAVWIDVDYACGSCHGGGTNPTDNPPAEGQTWRSKTALAARAAGIHGTANPPDLVMLSVSSASSIKRGVATNVYDATKNRLAGAAGASSTAVYLSTNATWDGGDTLLNSRAVPALAGGAYSTGPISITIPGATAPGTYYLIWKADNGSAVTETDETNNTKAKAITVLN